MRAKRTESIGDVARRLVERADPRGQRHGARAVDAWSAAAGPEIARHTHGAFLKDGRLTVYVDSAAWANELALMTDRLLAAIRIETGQDLVKSIRFTVSKKVAEKREEERQDSDTAEYYEAGAVSVEPLSETEQQQAAHIAAAVHDDTLREVALRVMVKDLEWKKGARTRKSAETRTDGPGGRNSNP